MNVVSNLPGDEVDPAEVKALEVLKAGIAATPELKVGLGVSIAMALVMAVGRMIIPISIQQILDKGINDGDLEILPSFHACGTASTCTPRVSRLLDHAIGGIVGSQ